MSTKVFPIKTATACRLKWAWSTLYLNSGQTSSCHRSSHSTLDSDNFEDFHNTDKKISSRQDMLESKWPGDGCEYCRDIESSGGISDRLFQNKIPDVYPHELDKDPTQVVVNPTILEVFFSNTCNLKCVYCEASLSSAIQAEDTKFGGSAFTNLRFEDNNRYQEFAPKFWSWFENNHLSLQRLQILGGEPLLQKDFFKLLEFFETNPCPNLEFNIVTNLSVPTHIVEKASAQMAKLLREQKLKRVDIQASIDCWGPGQEYVRTGLNLNLFEQNLTVLTGMKIFRIGLLSTVCSLTIPEMENLVHKHKEWSQQQEIFWYMHLVLPSDSIFSPTIFNSNHLVEKLENVYNLLPSSSWDQQQTLEVLLGIIKRIKTSKTNNLDKQLELTKYLAEIDRRRSLDWKKTFSWLATEIEHVV